MCGILGFLSESAQVSEAEVDRALDALQHRGPDGRGIVFSADREAVIGHTRLSMVDIEGGQQPFYSKNNDIIVAVNGELYDYIELREDLERSGAVFQSKSDCELVLHLYEKHGLEFPVYLRGEFAAVIWDGRYRRMIAVRDRFGIKPLCYSLEKGVAVASEAKAIFALGTIAPEWDHDSFYHVVSRQYVPASRTLFKGIYQLEAGCMLIADSLGSNIHRYWDIDYKEEQINEKEAIDGFRYLFHEAVKARLTSDVPLCVHLSGGLDSTSVAAVMSQYQKVSCFSVSFENENYDEFQLAQNTAEYLNAELHSVKVSQADMLEGLGEAVYFGEGTGINGHYTSKYLLNKLIRDHGFKGALTGEGADELLAGYPHIREDIFSQDSVYLEELHRTNEASAGVMINCSSGRLNLSAVEKAMGYIPSFIGAKAGLGYRLHSLLADDFLEDNKERDCQVEFLSDYDINKSRGRADKSLYCWNKSCLPVYILRTLGDGCEMASSVEGRLPFLDHKLFEFCQKLPLSLKINKGIEKHILREAVKDLIPEQVYCRQKHPFMAPPLFSDKRVIEIIKNTVISQRFDNLPFFDGNKVRKLLETMPDMKAKAQKLWDPVIYTMLTSLHIQERLLRRSYV